MTNDGSGMTRSIAALVRQDFTKFLVSGGFNTIVTYGLYLVLLSFFPYTTSYTVSFLVGIVLAYLLNRYFVFNAHNGIKSVLLLPLVYILQYGMSMLVLWFWIEQLSLAAQLAPLAAIVVTVPITFILSKYIFTKRPVGPAPPNSV